MQWVRLYADADGTVVAQTEMLRRSAVVAACQRAMGQDVFVTAYYATSDTPVHRLSIVTTLEDNSDLSLSELLVLFGPSVVLKRIG